MKQEKATHFSDRIFGLSMAGACAVLAGFVWWRTSHISKILIVIAVAFVLLALIAPIILLPLNRLWARFAQVMGRLNNTLVMGVVYFVVLTPFGIVWRMLGGDALRLRFDTKADTYFSPVERKVDALTLHDQF